MSDPGLNTVTLWPNAPPLLAPAPPSLPGKVLVRRVHAHVPAGLFAGRSGWGRRDWLARLRKRYPAAVRKAVWHLRTEGLRQTWAKIRTRAALERWSAAYGAFAAVGVVVESSPSAPPPGAAVLCWSWQGPVDADFHLVAAEQCLPVPDLAPEYALAPLLGWMASVLRRIDPGIAACRLVGIDRRAEAPLRALLGPPVPGTGTRVVVGCGPALAAAVGPGELAVRLSPERAGDPLIEPGARQWVCRLPDPTRFFVDPYYPGSPEWPEPFGRAAVEEAVRVLTRHGGAGSPPAGVTARPARTFVRARGATVRRGGLGVSCLGAGNYVRAVLLHHLRRQARIVVRGVMDVRPEVAALQARALGAAFCTTDPAAVWDDTATRLVLIASDHASHADYAVTSLRAGKVVHLEKPPAVEPDQLARLLDCLSKLPRPRLHLGYNRPHAPAVRDLHAALQALNGPTVVTCVVEGYRLPRAHWYNWPNQGTRIAGNLVHWIDLGYRLSGRQVPIWVDVACPDAPGEDALALSVGFADGSLVTITFAAAGDETLGIRERVRVERQDLAAEIDDFCTLTIDRAGRRALRHYRRDKGVAGGMAALVRRLASDEWDAETAVDLARTGAIQFAAQAVLARSGGRARVEPVVPGAPA